MPFKKVYDSQSWCFAQVAADVSHWSHVTTMSGMILLRSGKDEIGPRPTAGVSLQPGETGALSVGVRHVGE